MRFSEREGFVPARTVFQTNSMDQGLRNGLWNAVSAATQTEILIERDQGFFVRLWALHFRETVDTAPSDGTYRLRELSRFVFDCQWYQVYDVLEFILVEFPFSIEKKKSFVDGCNFYLERERSAWRLVGQQIARLTSEEEIQAIVEAEALEDTFASVATHIRTALKHLSDKQNPDYRNSIKESISAVESACRVISGKPKATLGDALKQLENAGVALHPAQRGAFNQLYGYTSDEGGVRHSLLEESTLDFEDAKLMLVLCAGFVNFLKARYATSA